MNRSLIALALAGAILATPVAAADAIGQLILDETPVVANDWDGFYAGVYGAYEHTSASYGLGVAAGVNAQFDFVLLGAEVGVQGLTNGTDELVYGTVLGKAGVVVTDDLVAYGAAGYGLNLQDVSEDHILVGGGVEYKVFEDTSIRAQYLHGYAVDGGTDTDQVTVGLFWHF